MPNPFRTSNPALNEKAFQGADRRRHWRSDDRPRHRKQNRRPAPLRHRHFRLDLGPLALARTEIAMPWMIGGIFGGLIAAFVTIFKSNWAPITAPIYALLEGLVLGGISAVFDKSYPGIAFHAIGLTFGVLVVMLVAYKTGTIRVTQRFQARRHRSHRRHRASSTSPKWFSASSDIAVPAINGSGIIGIGFSLLVVVVAALNLVLDFDMIETGAAA